MASDDRHHTIGYNDLTTSPGSDDAPEARKTTRALITLRPAAAYETELVSESERVTQQVEPLDLTEGRYRIGRELGRGGEGRVALALDLEIGRVIALKTLLDRSQTNEARISDFVQEAQVTAQLEHPGVVPIYDLGVLPDGRPFYTMRVVKQRSLGAILRSRETRAAWTLARLCTVFVQVCRAIDYAHARGVVHCDLKPDNILIGDYGEVYVADWGLARVMGSQPMMPSGGLESSQFQMFGTPGYLAPEQASADWGEISSKTDVYSLGVTLYEILTGTRPFHAPSRIDTVMMMLRDAPRPPRELVPDSPLVLQDLCLKMLAREQHNRPQPAEVAAEVEAFLDGAKEKARRREEARRLVARAREPIRRRRLLEAERQRLLAEARRQLENVRGWDPVEHKIGAWELEERAQALSAEEALALAETIELLTQALGHDPASPEARSGLADLYWTKREEALAARDEPTRIYYESLVREYDEGPYVRIMEAPARLSLRTNPPGAEIYWSRYETRARRLVPVGQTRLGRSPIENIEVEPGSYLFTIRAEGFRDTRYPAVCLRGEHHEATVNLYTDAEIGEGYVYVAGGACTIGGDQLAINSLPRMQVDVDDFAIGVFPVTYGQYLQFINDLQTSDPETALRRRPHADRDDVGLTRLDGNIWVPVWENLVEGSAREFCPRDRLADIPVDSVSWYDAWTYCAWLTRRDGVEHTIPTEAQWEKASRGVDERTHPWGNGFDPTFCKMRYSRPGVNQVEPVGTFPLDESCYGVRDTAGLILNWSADVIGEASADQLRLRPERHEEDSPTMRIVRGSSWLSGEFHCRCSTRMQIYSTQRALNVGIRVIRKLSPR